mgnify:CR=1 FL=1
MIILHFQTFKMFHETSLKITASWCFDCSINKSFSTCHAMEKELLISQPCKESIADESRGSRIGIICNERRKGFSCNHHRNSTAFKLLLTKHHRDLGMIDVWSLCTSYSHHAEIILWEFFHKTFQTIFNNSRAFFM